MSKNVCSRFGIPCDREKTDVHLRFKYRPTSLRNTTNNDTEVSSPLAEDNPIETKLFKFSDVIKDQANPLFNKLGFIADYSFRQNMMYQVMANDWPKRDYEFVIDCSGSMSGQPIAQTRNALLQALNKLPMNGS